MFCKEGIEALEHVWTNNQSVLACGGPAVKTPSHREDENTPRKVGSKYP